MKNKKRNSAFIENYIFTKANNFSEINCCLQENTYTLHRLSILEDQYKGVKDQR